MEPANERDHTLRWGIVGLGGFMRSRIAPAIQHCDRAAILACATRDIADARRFAEAFGVPRAYASVDELVEDPAIDAVFVATPNGEHRHAVIAAARAGKHVLCEKPLALSLEDAQAMVQACRQANVVLRMGLQFRLEEAIKHVRDIVASGRIGTPLMLHIERTSPTDQPGAWRHDRAKGGSVLYDSGVHMLDLASWIVQDDFQKLFAAGHRGDPASRSEDSLTVLGRMRNTCQSVIRISREAPFGNDNLTVMGTGGLISTGPLRLVAEHIVTVTTPAGTSQQSFAPTDLYGREIDAFVADVRTGATALPTGEDGLRLVTEVQAVLRSLDEDRAVDLM